MARDIDRAGNESPLATVEFVALDANPPPAPGVLGLEQLSGRKITGVGAVSSDPNISSSPREEYSVKSADVGDVEDSSAS